jgi:hypothetical protein
MDTCPEQCRSFADSSATVPHRDRNCINANTKKGHLVLDAQTNTGRNHRHADFQLSVG